MKHQNEQTLGDAIREFFENNATLRRKRGEIRVQRAWHEILGPTVAYHTRNVYVKNGVLNVCLTSSVLRSELLLHKTSLIKRLNEYAQADVIHEIVIR